MGLLPSLGFSGGSATSGTGPIELGNVSIGSNASSTGGISWTKIILIGVAGFLAWRWWKNRH